ncbi:MAG TPA: phospholipid carrier-dependent glycosyltransferase [Planctomycetes bacterium]|nr:phospholipid carrier-dependent glycosyltransferase [Planctomycetota bacterium]
MTTDGITRRTAGMILGLLLILSAVSRALFFSQLGFDHFDAAAYALSAQSVAEGAGWTHVFPNQHLLAPPLFFTLGGGLARGSPLGVDAALHVLAIVFGVALVFVTYLAGRSWFGRGAGLAAATLVALMDSFILFSRVALTDEAFCCFFLLALLAFDRARRRGSWSAAVLAGLAMGLAWNTKYHGWLAAVIAAAVIGVEALAQRRRPSRRVVMGWVAACAVGFLCYLPWLVHIVHQPGGYARLAAQHASFLAPAAAFDHLRTQAGIQLYLDGWGARVAPAAAFVLVALAGLRQATHGLRALAGLPLLLGLAWIVGGVGASSLLALAAVIVSFQKSKAGARPWTALAFLGLFTLLTPLYHPYARLLLPWLLAVALFAGAGLARFATSLVDDHSSAFHRGFVAVIGAATLVGAVAAYGFVPRPTPETWGPTDGLRRVAKNAASGSLATRQPVLVVGEPALVFYLREQGLDARHVDRLDAPTLRRHPGVAWALTGVYARRAGVVEEALDAALIVTVIPVHSWRWRVGEVRRLDDFQPWEARLDRARRPQSPQHRIDLWGLRRP